LVERAPKNGAMQLISDQYGKKVNDIGRYRAPDLVSKQSCWTEVLVESGIHLLEPEELKTH
jgi:hypothetical protein